MSLKGVAKETLTIIEAGQYLAPAGNLIDFHAEQQAAVRETVLYTPEQGNNLLARAAAHATSAQPPVFEVTEETTQAAAYRLVVSQGCHDLVLLNYASARNPGGGFINGAKAQEEDLSRCSGLYRCLLKQQQYYQANRAQDSLLYTDHVIYSPRVPWFRIDSRELLDNFFLASVITAPAPNAGEALRRNPAAWPAIEEVLRRRAGIVLAVARAHGHRTLLLGAWGCGVFRNRAEMVADAFGQWLTSEQFANCFARVVFAVYGRSSEKANLRAFQARFAQAD